MKRILCPTDFSETADEAIVYAAKLCKKLGAELTLFNVQSIFSLPPEEVIKGKYLATEPILDRLEEKSYEVMKVFKITCLSEVEPSNKRLSDIIVHRANDFDLVVMGTNGADDYYDFFFGSRSYQVVKESAVPVLLIPSGSGYQDITSIVFAFDYEHEHKLPMKQFSKLTSLLDVKLTVLQVKSHYTQELEMNSKMMQDEIKKSDVYGDIDFDTIYSNDVISSINSYVLQHEFDALALCTIHHSAVESVFHQSVIKALSSITNYPIFVFHE